MSESICPNCQHEIEPGAKICENCGEWIIKPGSQPKPVYNKRKTPISTYIILVMILAIVVSCFSFFSKQNTKQQTGKSTAIVQATKTKAIKPTTQVGIEATNEETGEEATAEVTTYELKYEVSGTAVSYNMSYTDETGQTVEKTELKLPTKIAINVNSGQAFVADLTAQNNGTFGVIICRIYIDGQMVAEMKNSEEKGSVTCSYTID